MSQDASRSELPWAELDALLEQALCLEGADRVSFLAGLAPSLRQQIEQVLTGDGADFVDALVEASLDGALDEISDTTHAPRHVGPWRLERELGAGGMAQVFEASRTEADFEQLAAVKILWPFRTGAQFHDRFVLERRILAGMNHPGIAGLLDGGVMSDGRPWFAMERVEGKTIVEHCAVLSVEQRLEVFLQVCDAVEFAHGRLVVHRDIKPANILVDRNGRARLLDFGIAKIIDEADESPTTRSGGSLMTLQYASPEQVTQAPLTVASDIYQLGVLLYQLVSGHLPYDLADRSLKQAIDVICQEQPKPPSAFNPGIRSDLDAIVLFAIRKEPERRYASVSALTNDLRQFLADRPVAARPHGRGYLARRFLRRHAAGVGFGAAAFVALAIAAAVSLNMAHRAEQEAERSATAMNVLAGVFEQADPFDQPGPDVTLGEALRKGIDGIAADVEHDPILAAQVFNRLGLIFNQLGMFEESQAVYQRTLDVAAGAEMAEEDRISALSGVAHAMNARGEFQQALAFIENNRPPPSDAVELVRLQVYLLLEEATAMDSSGDLAGQQRVLERVRTLIDRFGIDDPEMLLLLHERLSQAARGADDVTGAETHTREAITQARAAGKPWAEAVLTQNLAIYLGRQGKYEQSEPLFLKAMAILDEQAPGHPSRLEFATNYAGLLFRTGRMSEAMSLLTETIGALTGTPDQHLWAYAHRDLATYALAVGELETSIRANREFLAIAPALYGESSPRNAVALVMLARHLSLAGLHTAAIDVMGRVVDQHGKIGPVDLSPFLAEVRLDAGQGDKAVAGYDPDRLPDDPNARLLGLKFACVQGDFDQLSARIDAIEPDSLTASHLDQRLSAWRDIGRAALARRSGEDPAPALIRAYRTLVATPRLSVLEEWRLVRELVALEVVPDEAIEHSRRLASQRQAARRVLLDDYLPQGSERLAGLELGGGQSLPVYRSALACLH